MHWGTGLRPAKPSPEPSWANPENSADSSVKRIRYSEVLKPQKRVFFF
jgi:hypothetical protein